MSATYDAIVVGGPGAQDRPRPCCWPGRGGVIHAPGVAALRRWGLLARVTGSGCPPVDVYSFDFGPTPPGGRGVDRVRPPAGVAAATVSPGEFFAPEHIGAVMAAAAGGA